MKPAGDGAASVRIPVGRISGIYGVAGWVRVESWTRPITNILNYSPWRIGEGEGQQDCELLEGRAQGNGLVAKLRGLEDRDVARTWIGKRISVLRGQMPELPEGQYYWCDLIGMDVSNRDGINLGKLTDILETGANDVLVIEGEQRHLVPLILDRYVLAVDLQGRRITVDWEPDYS